MAFENSIVILDVGHGNCTVVRHGQDTLVIDAGRRSCLLEFLEAAGVETINAVLLSHADADHIGGLIGLLATGRFRIGEVRLNTDSLKESALWEDVVWTLNEHRKKGELRFQPSLTVEDSGVFDLGESVGVEILAPSPYLAAKGPGSTDRAGNRISHNSVSAVIRITKEGEPIALLTGDLDEVGLEHLEAEGVDSTAPILVFPHHGGNPGTGEIASFVDRLLRIAAPTTVVFSIGRETPQIFPRPEVVAQVRVHGAQTRVMCTQLSKHCAVAVPTANPDHLVLPSTGSEKRSSCSGTIVIPLDNLAAIVPDTRSHSAFIRQAATTPLCIG